MKSQKSTNKKYGKIVKSAIILLIVLLLVVAGFMIYKNLFESSDSSRFVDKEKYELTKKEINSAKDHFQELETIKEIDVYTNQSKIIVIFITVTDETELDKIKNLSNGVIEKFSEENLSYYDLEIFVDDMNEEGQIGYKHKTSTEFVW